MDANLEASCFKSESTEDQGILKDKAQFKLKVCC